MSKQAAPRRVGEKEALAVATTVRGSAYKLNLVAGLIRGKKAGDALNILAFSKKAMAIDVRKVLASAIANADNNHNLDEIGRASCRERVCQYVEISVVHGSLKKKPKIHISKTHTQYK